MRIKRESNSFSGETFLHGRFDFASETEHSGQCSSRCEDEDDSEDEHSDNKEAAHSDAENDDQNNSTVSRVRRFR